MCLQKWLHPASRLVGSDSPRCRRLPNRSSRGRKDRRSNGPMQAVSSADCLGLCRTVRPQGLSSCSRGRCTWLAWSRLALQALQAPSRAKASWNICARCLPLLSTHVISPHLQIYEGEGKLGRGCDAVAIAGGLQSMHWAHLQAERGPALHCAGAEAAPKGRGRGLQQGPAEDGSVAPMGASRARGRGRGRGDRGRGGFCCCEGPSPAPSRVGCLLLLLHAAGPSACPICGTKGAQVTVRMSLILFCRT